MKILGLLPPHIFADIWAKVILQWLLENLVFDILTLHIYSWFELKCFYTLSKTDDVELWKYFNVHKFVFGTNMHCKKGDLAKVVNWFSLINCSLSCSCDRNKFTSIHDTEYLC